MNMRWVAETKDPLFTGLSRYERQIPVPLFLAGADLERYRQDLPEGDQDGAGRLPEGLGQDPEYGGGLQSHPNSFCGLSSISIKSRGY
jgi:hypothetical protein